MHGANMKIFRSMHISEILQCPHPVSNTSVITTSKHNIILFQWGIRLLDRNSSRSWPITHSSTLSATLKTTSLL